MACIFPAKRTEDQIWSIKTQIKPVCGRTTIVSLNRRNFGTKPCEEERNTQDNDNEHTSIHRRAHLPKMTTDHRRDINIFSMCWTEERTSDKIQHRTSTNNEGHVKQLYFALDSALTPRAKPTMPTTRPLGTHNMCFAAESQLDCLLPTTRFIQLLNCNVRTPSHQISVRKTITLACFRHGLPR